MAGLKNKTVVYYMQVVDIAFSCYIISLISSLASLRDSSVLNVAVADKDSNHMAPPLK